MIIETRFEPQDKVYILWGENGYLKTEVLSVHVTIPDKSEYQYTLRNPSYDPDMNDYRYCSQKNELFNPFLIRSEDKIFRNKKEVIAYITRLYEEKVKTITEEKFSLPLGTQIKRLASKAWNG